MDRGEVMEDRSEVEVGAARYDGDLLDRRPRESSKHRSKERKDHEAKDRERSKERGRDDSSRKQLDRHDARERDRERRKEGRSEHDKDREHDRERHREKERSRDKGREHRDRELDLEKEHDRGRGRGRDHDKDTETLGERESSGREYERGSDRRKVIEHSKDTDKDHDKSRVCEKDYEKQVDKEKAREKDHRDRGKDKDRDRAKERDKEREKDREKVRDREREKEKVKGREREEKENDRPDRTGDKEKYREGSVGNQEPDIDKSRVRDITRSKVGEEGERSTVDGGNNMKDVENHPRLGLNDHDEYPVASQSSYELKERLTKLRQERMKKSTDNASEILSWVSKSRKLVERRNLEREKAERISKKLDEQDDVGEESDDETAAAHRGDLAGVKILHGLDKVIEGGNVVLTLKDQSILADGDVNEEIDMLENVEIGEQRRRDDAYKAAKKMSGYDDKFNNDMDSRRPILPQYDDPVEDEGVTLDETGRFTGEAEKKLEELRKRVQGGSTNRSFEDLNSSSKNVSDYFTPDEMLQFKKPKKKKSLRKREKLDLDALEAEAVSAGLGGGDLGSRKDSKRLSAKEEAAKTDAEMRSKAYQSALAKAEEASKILRQEQTLSVKTEEDEDMVFGEDYEDLEKSLEQARKLALKRQEEAAPSGPHAVALLATTTNGQEDTKSSTIGDTQENKVIITEMEEFVLGLQLNEETQKPESEDVFNDEEDVPEPVNHEMEVEAGGWTDNKETSENEEHVKEEREDVAPDEIIHEVPVGKGLSGALKLLKERGTLNESIDWGGRNMDKKKSKLVGINDNSGTREIRIERTDEFGRIMTPKEAFRTISHKFHGKMPGKMKQEKRMKQYQEDLKAKQASASDTPLASMERMRQTQAQLQTPYIVLSGHVKPGQSGDARSGYGTLEKDLPGGLTPMLGDKKVEHYLGIKRKPDSGSMPPPPPKKPKS